MPTATPTEEPTAEPTVEPTAVPTAVPTPEPTIEPTAVPTVEPTDVPTADPTAEPTTEPSAVPTPTPTEEPTAEPTQVPTEVPTAEPTSVPTLQPTIEPTPLPTLPPTDMPTPLPTLPPSWAPTGCLVRGAKMHVLFKKDAGTKLLSTRRLLEEEVLGMAEDHANSPAAAPAAAPAKQRGNMLDESAAETLRNALAMELKLSPNQLAMQQFPSPTTGLIHTEFMFHSLDAIKLGRDLEAKVLTNQFYPLPDHPIHRLYLEEVFDCGEHAVGATHTFDGTNGDGNIKYSLPDSGYQSAGVINLESSDPLDSILVGEKDDGH